MSKLLLRRKSTIKPIPIVKKRIEQPAIEFRWSTEVAQGENLSPNFHLIDLENQQPNSSLSSPSPTNRLSSSTQKLSPHSSVLPNINNINKKKEVQDNNHEKINPLILNYSQLHRVQPPIQTKKPSQTHFSIYPLINNKRNNISLIKNNLSTNQQQLKNDKYIRLQTSQLRRLNVSEKYIKEAKKLYFNANSKVFLPRHSITEIS